MSSTDLLTALEDIRRLTAHTERDTTPRRVFDIADAAINNYYAEAEAREAQYDAELAEALHEMEDARI